jgi:hypothetical protein
MNIIKTIKKAAKAVISTMKDIIAMFKTNYEVKKAKVKAWHKYKKITNPDYINHLITILIALVKIFIPLQVVRAVSGTFFDGWDERY